MTIGRAAPTQKQRKVYGGESTEAYDTIAQRSGEEWWRFYEGIEDEEGALRAAGKDENIDEWEG